MMRGVTARRLARPSSMRWICVVLLLGCSSTENGASQTARSEPPAAQPPADPPVSEPVSERRAAPAETETEGAAFDVSGWQSVLDRYATEDGGFRYAALHASDADRARLDAFVRSVGEAEPASWARDEQLAFYIDAYNALTVSAVIAHWPIESVMRVEGFFDAETHRVAGRAMTLNQLENDVIRGDAFAEPRIHFAVNCASVGCPPLSRQAYTAENLEAQLAAQTEAFVRATTEVSGRRARLSQIFEWFAADFEPAGGVRAFVADQLEGDDADRVRDPRTRLAYAPYDWAINARR